ncbi:MAG: DUF302 domain-containing protein [Bdellovibrionales bacterium]|nr:DUF302 domain-containing protein [Bdellovibrionales bacterium]
MTSSITMKREVSGTAEEVVERVTNVLKAEGFGVLTRIDFHSKMKEKLGKDLPPVVILGACNPSLAYEAYQANTDVAALLPCNAVVREIGSGKCSVELAKPSGMMTMLGNANLVKLAATADDVLARALAKV